jgi:hypothetical protein
VIIIVATVLALLVALGVATDVFLTRRVEHRLTEALRCVTGDESLSPGVSLGSTPLLLQMVSGKLDTVDITGIPADDLASKKLLGSGDIDLTLHGVHAGKPPSIGSMDASATVGWDAVTDRLRSAADGLSGATVGEQDGLLAVTLTQQLLGQPVKVLMSAKTDGGSLVALETVVLGNRQLQASLLSGLAGGLEGSGTGQNPLEPRTLDLDLPAGASLSSVEVRPEGLAVDLAITPAALGNGTFGAGGSGVKGCLA